MKTHVKGTGPTTGHLAYYKRHGISPVRYLATDAAEHFERRDALYRLLGLPPVAFKGARVLEVAPGSGRNSLYIATCHPATYDLVEPNPTGQRDIETAFAKLEVPHTRPALHPVMVQDFQTHDQFDIVVCENWLGSLPQERDIIAAMAGLVAPGGVMVITAVPLAGFFPNIMRKLLALRLTRLEEDFDTTTERLLSAFSPHLATIAAMTRSHRDWVHDCMMNPHYLHVALPFETLLKAAGDDMEVLATCPRFAQDWRWFKTMVGAGRSFNKQLLASELADLHNFMDCRKVWPRRRPEDNAGLANALNDGHRAALAWQMAHLAEDAGTLVAATASVSQCLERLRGAFDAIDANTAEALAELRDLWDRDHISPEDVASLHLFSGVFGRETIYVSLTRPSGDGR